jgi:ABC transporter substrate binding protein
VVGRNVAIEYRWAEGRIDRLPAMVADLVHRQVAVIAATTTPAALAAKAATTTIPIVFETGGDPVQLGLVPSLNRPGGNVTGVTQTNWEITPKRLQLLHELVPTTSVIALLVNPANPTVTETTTKAMQAAAPSFGLELHVLNASTERDFDGVFAKLTQLRAGGLVIGQDPFFASQREQLAALTVRHAVPAIGGYGREFAAAGGLLSYGADVAGRLPPHRQLYRSGSQGREACRPAGAAGNQSRDVYQPEDRQGARRQRPQHANRSRRWSDRIAMLFAAVHESAIGPKQTSVFASHMSAIGGKADIGWCTANVRL